MQAAIARKLKPLLLVGQNCRMDLWTPPLECFFHSFVSSASRANSTLLESAIERERREKKGREEEEEEEKLEQQAHSRRERERF